MHLLVIAIILLFIFFQPSKNDPFRYIWSIALLDQTYRELEHNNSLSSSIKRFYKRAQLRIEEGEKTSRWLFSTGFFTEVEYVMKTRRSLDVLRKRTWEYAKELAKAYGYHDSEVEKENFSCPGWNQLWEMYHKHKNRILSKKHENATKWQWAGSAAFGDDFKTDSSNSNHNNNSEHQKSASEKIKSKNQNLFHDIWDLKELKKKYFRLAKLNHPDRGGSDEAMKVLNRYYQEALQRILAREDS